MTLVLIHSGRRLLSRFIILIFSYRSTLRRAWSAERYASRTLRASDFLMEINVPPLRLQLGGFVEKYAGSGVTLHPQSGSNKENRRTEGLNRYLQTLQSHQSTATGRVKRGDDGNIIIFINKYYLRMMFLHNLPWADQLLFFKKNPS